MSHVLDVSTDNGGIRSMSHLNDAEHEAEGRVSVICGGKTNYGLRHNATYSGTTTGTKDVMS